MKIVMTTFIVKIGNIYKLLFQTIDGKYFLNTHIVGEVKEVDSKEATELLNN